MSVVTAEAVRSLLLERFGKALATEGIEAKDVGDDFDLLARGVTDSLGVLEMISAIEQHFGMELDLEELDPEQLTVIGPLCQFIEDKSREDSSRSVS